MASKLSKLMITRYGARDQRAIYDNATPNGSLMLDFFMNNRYVTSLWLLTESYFQIFVTKLSNYLLYCSPSSVVTTQGLLFDITLLKLILTASVPIIATNAFSSIYTIIAIQTVVFLFTVVAKVTCSAVAWVVTITINTCGSICAVISIEAVIFLFTVDPDVTINTFTPVPVVYAQKFPSIFTEI